MVVTAVASYVHITAFSFFSGEKCNIFRPKLPRNYPEVGANGTCTHSMLTDQALLLYSEMTTNRQFYVRTIRYITGG